MAKRILFLFVSLACFSDMAFAQKDYLCLYSRNQTDNQSWAINEVRKLTFSSDAINIFLWQETEPYVFDYDSMHKLTFEELPLPSSVQGVELQTMAVKYDASRKSLLISGMNSNGMVLVYTIGGTLSLSSVISMQQTEIPFTTIPKGLYIVKISSGERIKSIKIQIQ